MDEPLRSRLAELGVDPDEYRDAFDVWSRLRMVHGARASLVDLYTLAAHPRRLSAHQLSLAEREQLTTRALPLMFPDFQLITDSGRAQRDPIEVVSYDEEWPKRYEVWRTRLTEALGATAQRIEHIGSTAVPGMPAKPVIDIQVSVEDVDEEHSYVPQIEALGLQLRSRDAGHRFFRPFSGLAREVQVHVCTVASVWEREHFLFRDYLRADPAAAGAYVSAKLMAAARWRDDRVAYTEAKGGQILDLMGAAEEWARRVGWSGAIG